MNSHFYLFVLISFIFFPVLSKSLFDGDLCSSEEEHSFRNKIRPKDNKSSDRVEINDHQIQLDLSTKDHPSLLVEVKVEDVIYIKIKDDDKETDDAMIVTIDKIVEFIDDGKDGYSQQPILSSIDLEDSFQWNSFSCSCPKIDGENVNQCTIISDDSTVVFVLLFSDHSYRVASQVIYPTWIKFNFEIHDYNYTVNNSILATHMTLKSDTKSNLHDSADEDDEAHASNWKAVHSEQLTMAWNTEAGGPGGQLFPVISPPISSSKTHSFYFSFDSPNVDTIIWDAALGTFSSPPITVWGIFAIVSGVLIGASLSVAAILKWKQKTHESQNDLHIQTSSENQSSDLKQLPIDTP